jgi:hypothetical protein
MLDFNNGCLFLLLYRHIKLDTGTSRIRNSALHIGSNVNDAASAKQHCFLELCNKLPLTVIRCFCFSVIYEEGTSVSSGLSTSYATVTKVTVGKIT